MTPKKTLKKHTPVSAWRNLNDHIRLGDIVYVTMPIKTETIRFRLKNNRLNIELDDESKLDIASLEELFYDLLEKDDWSSQFIGYAYQKEGSLVLYAIYDLTFQVYLDGITVQRIADAFGFKPHPIVFHGSVKPKENESISDFMVRSVSDSRRFGNRKNGSKERLIIENVSRLYEYRRIIGLWTYGKPGTPGETAKQAGNEKENTKEIE